VVLIIVHVFDRTQAHLSVIFVSSQHARGSNVLMLWFEAAHSLVFLKPLVLWVVLTHVGSVTALVNFILLIVSGG
jgi:hypothetical protein